jgi:hypothetical protein
LSGVKLLSTTGSAVIAGGVSRVQCRAAAVATPRVKDNLLARILNACLLYLVAMSRGFRT